MDSTESNFREEEERGKERLKKREKESHLIFNAGAAAATRCGVTAARRKNI
jgi:hypothetical protein